MATTKSGNAAAVREDGTYASDKDTQYDYVLRYIAESIDYRTKKVALTARAIEAYKGFPSHDGYINAINSYASMWDKLDKQKADDIRARCKNVKPRKNMIVMRAIDSMVAQGQGGVGQYECSVSDPIFEKTPELVDALEATAMDFYRRNHIDSLLSEALEYAGLSGAVYSFLDYKKDRPLSSGRIEHSLIPDTEMLIDPIGSKRTHPRYIGHQDKNVSWVDLKDKLVKCDHCDEYMLKSINNVDTLLQEVEYWINKYNGDFAAMFPAITGDMAGHYGSSPMMSFFIENLPQQIDTFYKSSALAWRERNSKFNHNAGGDTSMGNDDDKYHAQDVEVCYLIDLENDIQFTVVNRKFIVDVKKHPYHATVPYDYFELDPYSGKAIDKEGRADICLDSPYVPLCYKKSLWETYPYSPIVHILDMFDDICALESMIYHTISVMTPITFTGNPKDIEKLGAIAGVSGEAIKGFIGNSVTVLNKAVDLTPAMSELSRLESCIMSVLHGVDNKEQAQMIGNRATAAEAMQAASLVSQGLNSLIANVETWAEELADKMFKMTVIMEPDDFIYDLNIDGKHTALTRKDLAGDLGIHAVLKSRIKAEQHAQAANTIQWFVPLMGSDAIVNKEAFAATIVPTLAEGFTRKTIRSWFTPTEQQMRAQEAQIELQKQQAAAAEAQAKKDKGIDMSYVDPSSGGKFGAADIAQAISGGIQTDPQATAQYNAEAADQQNSRKLNYGLAPEMYGHDKDINPSEYPQANGMASNAVAIQQDLPESEDDTSASQQAINEMLSPLMGTNTGGLQANDGITGVNSPLSQGTM